MEASCWRRKKRRGRRRKGAQPEDFNRAAGQNRLARFFRGGLHIVVPFVFHFKNFTVRFIKVEGNDQESETIDPQLSACMAN